MSKMLRRNIDNINDKKKKKEHNRKEKMLKLHAASFSCKAVE